MDNFCAKLDDNMGRCSCSPNITKYSASEAALKKADDGLRDAATQMKYLGLTADQVRDMFRETAAEEAMRSSSDNSAMKTQLDKILKMIQDPKTPGDTSGGGGSAGLGDLDFSAGNSMTLLFGSSNDSVSGMRGAALYDTAKSRCAPVASECKKQGADAARLGANYDLAVDKACMTYERYLIDQNDSMKSAARNAENILQQARLTLARQKNLDLKSCISALDACMRDDFVCGQDYVHCLDPSQRYISNGVVQNTARSVLAGAESAAAGISYLVSYIWGSGPFGWDSGGVNLIKKKIGTPGDRNGMCESVFDRCADSHETVIKHWMENSVPKIMAGMRSVLSEYSPSKSDLPSSESESSESSLPHNYCAQYSVHVSVQRFTRTVGFVNRKMTSAGAESCMCGLGAVWRGISSKVESNGYFSYSGSFGGFCECIDGGVWFGIDSGSGMAICVTQANESEFPAVRWCGYESEDGCTHNYGVADLCRAAKCYVRRIDPDGNEHVYDYKTAERCFRVMIDELSNYDLIPAGCEIKAGSISCQSGAILPYGFFAPCQTEIMRNLSSRIDYVDQTPWLIQNDLSVRCEGSENGRFTVDGRGEWVCP